MESARARSSQQSQRPAWREREAPTAPPVTDRRAGAPRPDGQWLAPPEVLALQRSAGNRAVLTALGGAGQGPVATVQRKHILDEDRSAAQEALGKTYQKISITRLGGGDLEQGDEFWETHLSSHTLTGLLGELLAPLNDEERQHSRVGVTLLLEQAGSKVRGIRIKINVVDPQKQFVPGAATFVLNKLFELDEQGALTSKIETIVAPGRSRPFFRDQLLPALAAMGITKVTLTASQIMGYNAPGGVSVWARYGFIPEADQWARMRESGQGKLDDLPSDSEFHDLVPALQEIYQDEDPRALRRLALMAMAHPEVADHVTSVVLVDQNWKGTIDLGEPEARRWITTYVKSDTKAFLAAMGPQ